MSDVAPRRDLHETQFNFRVRARELAQWKKAAKRADEPVSLWARKMLNLASAPPPAPVPPTISGDQVELSFPNKKKAS